MTKPNSLKTLREGFKGRVRQPQEAPRDTKLPVIFRIEDRDEVVAVFPTLTERDGSFTVYGRIGQHSTGTMQWYRTTKPASPEAYRSLLAELRRIYESGPDAVRLHVIERMPPRSLTHESKRQPSLPGFPDIPDPIEVEIPTMPWEQIGGDMDLSGVGGIIATADGDHIELLEIQPVREYVGDGEAADVGFPFWTKEAWFDLSDLDPKNEEVQSALASLGFDSGDQKRWFEEEATPTQRAMVIAEALLRYGRGDEGPAGWSEDLPDYEVKVWGNKVVSLQDYLSDEDESFRNDVLGYDDIRSNLETEMQRQVDESAAQGWSQLDDQTVIDLDDQGYDGSSAFVIGVFGNEPMIAVNSETTFGADFAREIGVKKTANDVYIWSEIGTRQLEAWLRKNGYETTDRGGDVPSVEGYAYAEHVIRAVAGEMEIDEDVVAKAAEGLDWWPKSGNDEIPGSTGGETTVWAKKVETAEEEELEEAPRRRRRG